MNPIAKNIRIQRRRNRVRARIGSAWPKLTVSRSQRHIVAQIINPDGRVLASANDFKYDQGTQSDRAVKVGQEIAQKATTLGIDQVVFDRGCLKYHGVIKALAQAARDQGLRI